MSAQLTLPGKGVYVTVRATGQVGRVTALTPQEAPLLAAVDLGDHWGMFTAGELDTVDVRYQKPVLRPMTSGELAVTIVSWFAGIAAAVTLIGFAVVLIGIAVS